MLRLTKRADYGLIALKALGQLPPEAMLSARELSEKYRLPADLTPKVLAQLARAGLVEAAMGKSGGYRLARPAALITVAEVLRALDGDTQIAPCNEGMTLCQRFDDCDIRDPLASLNKAVLQVFDQTSIAQL